MKMMQFEGAKLWNEIPDYIKSFTEIKKISLDVAMKNTTKNFLELFSLK